jgi:ABC-type phosphate transport system permease subunit/ABC-type phosphate transport system substrate-binding protein
MSRGALAEWRISLAPAAAVAAALLVAAPAGAAPRSHAVIAGSSTVFPFAAAVAERAPGPGPLVLPMGSGAGIAWFCEGLGAHTPDIALASRAMTPDEASGCRVAGVTPLEPMLLGHDGIVLVAPVGGAIAALTLSELWRALAARVPDPAGGTEWVANPYRSWSDLRAGLPAMPIRVLGPPATSGTRDAFAALALRPACEAALLDHPQPDGERRQCGELRRDGAWQDAGENDDALVGRLRGDAAALGVVGFGALVRNPDRISAVCLDGVCPTKEKIQAGTYPLARPLYLYLKTAHRALVPGLDALVDVFFTPEAVGPGGYLVRLGLVPTESRQAGGVPSSHAVPGPGDLAARIFGIALVTVLLGLVAGSALVRRAAPARRGVERLLVGALWSSAVVTAALLALVLASLVVPTLNFFLQVSPLAFLAGTHWSPESAIRTSQAVGEGAFGVLPVLLGSVLVALIALALALPLALAAALHGFAWAGRRQRRAWRFGIRLAALVPAVVYGLFAALTVGPGVAAVAAALGVGASAQSTLAAGLVVGVMLLPVLAVRIEEVLAAVPLAAAEAALGLGATRWEALRDIVLPAAGPGIGAGVLLAVTRALGETVIVLMAAGLVAAWTLDPLGATTTLTAEIVSLMAGTHALDNVRTQLPFVLGLFLAMIVLPLNAWALRILRRSDVTPSPVF